MRWLQEQQQCRTPSRLLQSLSDLVPSPPPPLTCSHNADLHAEAVQESSLWACLAGWAVAAGDLKTAELAFAGCEEVDKLQYMLYIQQLPTREARLAELALYRHNIAEAESILLQVSCIVHCAQHAVQQCQVIEQHTCYSQLLQTV